MNYWQLAALTGLWKTRKEKNAINIDTGRISTSLTQVFLLDGAEESASSVQRVAWQQMPRLEDSNAWTPWSCSRYLRRGPRWTALSSVAEFSGLHVLHGSTLHTETGEFLMTAKTVKLIINNGKTILDAEDNTSWWISSTILKHRREKYSLTTLSGSPTSVLMYFSMNMY